MLVLAYAHAHVGHAGSGFGHMVASAAVHATVWLLLRQVFHFLGPWGSAVAGAIVLAIAWAWLRRQGRYS